MNTTVVKSIFELSDNGTLIYKNTGLMEYERTLPSLDDGSPQLVWFVDPKVGHEQNSRPFEISQQNMDSGDLYPLTPKNALGLDYSEFFICESCGNQLYLATSTWREKYLKMSATDNWDRYDWVELYAEPIF